MKHVPNAVPWICVLIATASLILPFFPSMRTDPDLLSWMPVLRFLAALCGVICIVKLRSVRRTRSLVPAFSLLLLLGLESAADIVLLTTDSRMVQRFPYATHYTPSEVDALQPQDIVLIGDSFVWAHGVEIHERFGNRLEALLKSHEDPGRVLSIGLPGWNVDDYVDALRLLPTGRNLQRIILAYYHNDFPRMSPGRASRNGSLDRALSRSSPSLRSLVSALINRLYPVSAEQYHQWMIQGYDSDRPEPWDVLERSLDTFMQEARLRSERPPVLAIFPLLTDDVPYPLSDSHRKLTEMAHPLGFEVLDLLPVYQRHTGGALGRGSLPDDIHPNVEGHIWAAEALFDHLTTPP